MDVTDTATKLLKENNIFKFKLGCQTEDIKDMEHKIDMYQEQIQGLNNELFKALGIQYSELHRSHQQALSTKSIVERKRKLINI